MQIAQVRTNLTVKCPPDRGDAGYSGKVVHVDHTEHKNSQGSPYCWVTVQHPSGSKHVWPSNRLQ